MKNLLSCLFSLGILVLSSFTAFAETAANASISYQHGSLVVDELVNITARVQTGQSISVGGGILPATHWQHAVALQTSNPNSENHVTIEASNGAVFVPTMINQAGIYGGLQSLKPMPFFELVSGQLSGDDTITIQYRNLRLPTIAGDLRLPVQVATDSSKQFQLIDAEPLLLIPGPVAQINVFAPSRVSGTETFTPVLRQLDRFGNGTSFNSPTYDVLVDGVFRHRIAAGGGETMPLEPLRFSEPGIHKLEVRSGGGGIRGTANPILVQSGTKKVLWGELHGHNDIGEVTGFNSLESTEAMFDFFINGIHQSYLTQENWRGLAPPRAWIADLDLRQGGAMLIVDDWQGTQSTDVRSLQRQISTTGFSVALSFAPVDDRVLDANHLRLVEIVSGESQFEWYANRLLQQGYRVGFSASAHSHVLPVHNEFSGNTQPAQPLTAALVDYDADWLTAVRSGRTYVTTGHRPVLQVTTNGGMPGSRLSMADKRSITGWVHGTGPIDKVELIKNGRVIKTLNVAGDQSQQTLKVSFTSSSEPFHGRDYPRNGREWLGFLRTSDTAIVDFAAPGFRNPSRQAIAKNGDRRIDFVTWTHGGESSFMLDLASINEETVLELSLGAGHEDIDFATLNRPSSSIDASRQMVSMFELLEGPVSRKIPVNGYEDTVTFELVNKEAETFVAFDFSDQADPKPGDYYYVRVQQLDDHVAWSSPVFIGGFDAP